MILLNLARKKTSKSILNPTNMYQCATPTIFLGLIFGITPMLPTGQNANHPFVTNKCLHLISCGYIVVYTAAVLLGRNDMQNRSEENTLSKSVITTTSTISLVMSFATTYTIYISSFKNTYKVLDILKSLTKIDGMLKQLGQEIKYKKDMYYEIIILLSIQLLQIITLSIQIWNEPRENLKRPTFSTGFMLYFPGILQNLLESHFVLLTMAVYQRFYMINQHLQNLSCHIKQNNIPVVIQRLDALMKLHDTLCDTTSDIDETYGGQMFISSLTQFEFIVTTTFTFYINMKGSPVDSYIMLIWGLIKTVELLRKVTVCHIAANEANSARDEVHKLFLCVTEEQTHNRLMEFSQQLMHRQVVFTARGMFNLDATLIFTVVSTVTTYIVILYQFNEATQPPTCYINPMNLSQYTHV